MHIFTCREYEKFLECRESQQTNCTDLKTATDNLLQQSLSVTKLLEITQQKCTIRENNTWTTPASTGMEN